MGSELAPPERSTFITLDPCHPRRHYSGHLRQLHEQAHGRGAPRAALGPEYHIILGWVAPAVYELMEPIGKR